MTSFVFAAVLFAALCHAGWNALIKGGLDPLATTTLITFGSAAVALILLPFAGMPDSAAWPWLIASSVVHLFYFAGLIVQPEQAEGVIANGQADMVAIARASLDDPHWSWHAARALGGDVPRPLQYQRAGPKLWAPAAKA